MLCATPFRKHPGEAAALLQEAGCELIESPEQRPLTADELISALSDAVGVIAGNDHFTADVIAAARRLRVISRWGIGVDAVDVSAATRHGVVVTNTPRLTADGVADLTFGLIMALARRIPEANRLVHAGGWGDVEGVNVWQKCLGIVGFGAIGQAVARRARGFDMRVLAYDVRRDEVTASGLATDYVPLDELLREADFVSIHASLTEQSRGMIGARELALMKPGAFLINAARGAIVDENAVVQALRENRIAGAALDVHWEEPLPRNHPLMTLDNCILTPHIGSHTIETARAVNAAAAQNLLDVLQGRRPRNVVNPEVYEAGSLR